jgi:hypothetical protein
MSEKALPGLVNASHAFTPFLRKGEENPSFIPPLSKGGISGSCPLAKERPQCFIPSCQGRKLPPCQEPKLIKRTEPMWLDVDINHETSYGSTLFWNEKQRPLPGSHRVEVQLDLDYKQFVDSFIAC